MKTHENCAKNIKFLHIITLLKILISRISFYNNACLQYLFVESHESFERKLHISSYPSSFAFNRLVSNTQRVRVRLQKRGVSNNILY